MSRGPAHEIVGADKDGAVRVAHAGGANTFPLVGMNRVAWRAHSFVWTGEDSRFLSLTPGEKTAFECVATVPASAVCTCDVAILGRRRLSAMTTQWRASCVSLPQALGAAQEHVG